MILKFEFKIEQDFAFAIFLNLWYGAFNARPDCNHTIRPG